MNIKDLENFYSISQYKSFSFASKMLGVTQPTLSESIKRLEKDIGTKLFYRSKTGIKLTPLGEKTLSYVKDLLNIKNEISFITKNQHYIKQSYKLGCHCVIAGYFLKNFLQELYSDYSNITIDLEHDRSQNIQKSIQDGKIDIGVVVNSIKNPDLIIKKLCLDKICIWKSKKVKSNENQVIADLGLTQVQSILRSWDQAPTEQISTNDFHVIGELAEAGIGYAILPEKFVTQKKLKLKQVEKKLFFKDEFSVVYRPEFGKNKVERFIVQNIINCFK